MKRYAIWNKKDPIFTPVGEVITAEQWIERYPIAGIDSITVVCAAGETNGAFFGTLGQMVDMYDEHIDFSAYTTPEEKIAAIEEYENNKQAEAAAKAKADAEQEALNAEMNATSLASIAANMEYQNMLTLDDVEV